jgi:hypothetical protein
MSTEEWVAKLDIESNALKQAFERSAYSMQVITKTLNFSTTQNAVTVSGSFGSFTSSDPERLIVTYDTFSGANTAAKLELSTNYLFSYPKVRRIPYLGGARWIVTLNSNVDSSWHSTACVLTVQSLVDGAISVTEATS